MVLRLAGGSEDLEAALWAAAVVRFFRCFTKLTRSGTLDPYPVFREHNTAGTFRRLEEARNRIVKHDRNSVVRFGTAIIQDGAGRLLGAMPAGTTARPDPEDYRALAQLIENTARYVQAQIGEACQDSSRKLEEAADFYTRKVLWERTAEEAEREG